MADAGVSLDVHLCHLPDDAAAMLPAAQALLPEALQAGLTRYRRPQDRLARVAARLLLRGALRALGLGQHAGLQGWRVAPGGRPWLAGCPADFSISHSAGWVGVAVARGARVGLDLEVHGSAQAADIAPLLTSAELAAIATAPDPAALLLQGWCRREAVLKADGRGLALPQAELREIGDGRFPDGRQWHVDVTAWPAGVAAVATDRPIRPSWHEWDWVALLHGDAAQPGGG